MVQADPPGVAQELVERELGAPVSELFDSFEPEPTASGSVAQVHRATLHDGSVVAVKVLHNGAELRVIEDLELMAAIATYLENEDPELAQLRPMAIVAEFSDMTHDAIDLSQELQNLQRFTLNFANEPDIVFPTPYPELSRRRVLTMSLLSAVQSLATRWSRPTGETHPKVVPSQWRATSPSTRRRPLARDGSGAWSGIGSLWVPPEE